MAEGLDRLYEMQRRPFGSNSALSSGSRYGALSQAKTDANQFQRQEQAYGRALRALDRSARRGDIGAALKAIDVRDKAMEDGFSPGGISNRDERDSRILGRVNTRAQRAQDAEFGNQQRREELYGTLQAGNGTSTQEGGTKAGYGTSIQAGGTRAGYGTPLSPARRTASQTSQPSATRSGINPLLSVPGMGAISDAAATARELPSSSAILRRDDDLTRKRNAVSALKERFAFDANQKKVMEDRAAREQPASTLSNQGPDFTVAPPEGGFQKIGEDKPTLVDQAAALKDINSIVEGRKAEGVAGAEFEDLTQAAPAVPVDIEAANKSAALRMSNNPVIGLEGARERSAEATRKYEEAMAGPAKPRTPTTAERKAFYEAQMRAVGDKFNNRPSILERLANSPMNILTVR